MHVPLQNILMHLLCAVTRRWPDMLTAYHPGKRLLFSSKLFAAHVTPSVVSAESFVSATLPLFKGLLASRVPSCPPHVPTFCSAALMPWPLDFPVMPGQRAGCRGLGRVRGGLASLL